jgi:hypothetical protein
MKETTLAAYLGHTVDAGGLRAELADAIGTNVLNADGNLVLDLTEEKKIRTTDLLRLCDDYLAGSLGASDLEAIAFFLIGSDHFWWDTDELDGALVAEVLFDWSAPEINYEITLDTVQRCRGRLVDGCPSRQDTRAR